MTDRIYFEPWSSDVAETFFSLRMINAVQTHPAFVRWFTSVSLRNFIHRPLKKSCELFLSLFSEWGMKDSQWCTSGPGDDRERKWFVPAAVQRLVQFSWLRIRSLWFLWYLKLKIRRTINTQMYSWKVCLHSCITVVDCSCTSEQNGRKQ